MGIEHGYSTAEEQSSTYYILRFQKVFWHTYPVEIQFPPKCIKHHLLLRQ